MYITILAKYRTRQKGTCNAFVICDFAFAAQIDRRYLIADNDTDLL